jgi:hypothetical protein
VGVGSASLFRGNRTSPCSCNATFTYLHLCLHQRPHSILNQGMKCSSKFMLCKQNHSDALAGGDQLTSLRHLEFSLSLASLCQPVHLPLGVLKPACALIFGSFHPKGVLLPKGGWVLSPKGVLLSKVDALPKEGAFAKRDAFAQIGCSCQKKVLWWPYQPLAPFQIPVGVPNLPVEVVICGLQLNKSHLYPTNRDWGYSSGQLSRYPPAA